MYRFPSTIVGESELDSSETGIATFGTTYRDMTTVTGGSTYRVDETASTMPLGTSAGHTPFVAPRTSNRNVKFEITNTPTNTPVNTPESDNKRMTRQAAVRKTYAASVKDLKSVKKEG